ncbi:MAG TPA: NADH:flavin oxidoreductase/NADH oxidase [Bryobacteraceae bacterium]|jgi:2,4-dienoyl-CoA reductase-like NADH-dependent reductase (Old Yellow Enzyme family)|nr:NADH:flavin oxidoreductase/NADH oxidase [Bryobacteraceae bacterium]
MSAINLLQPLTIRGVTLKNRIVVSPMCQYSSVDGMADDWHLVHLGSRAVGGAGLLFVEATAVTAKGRITPSDMGIWDDRHIEPLARIARFIHRMGGVAGIQLAHAGRKASCLVPWQGGGRLKTPDEGGWDVVAPSAIPFRDDDPLPHALDIGGIQDIVAAFASAARRAVQAGFRVIEIHSAHGYLLHSFLSPLSNKRSDSFGGSLENRMRTLLQVAAAIRQVLPDDMPLFTRISSTDWVAGGWDLDQSIALARELKQAGVDLVDASSGGLVPGAVIPAAPGFQVPFATAIREQAGIPTGAVGMITDPAQADAIVSSGQADLVYLAREMLREPYWALKAGRALGQEQKWPVQYERAKP